MKGWAGNEALRLLPNLAGLPTHYAALLIVVALVLIMQLHYVIAGVWITLVGFGLGKAVVYIDPFGWELFAKNLLLPRRFVL